MKIIYEACRVIRGFGSENAASDPSGSVVAHARFLGTADGMEPAEIVGCVPGMAEPSTAGALIGYARGPTRDQNLDRQIEDIAAAGCSVIFADIQSGKNSERPELRRLIHSARPSDALVVVSLDRLARSLPELILLLADLHRRGVGLKSLSEDLDTTAPGGQLIFRIFGTLAEFLRQLHVERTHEGLTAARDRGIVAGRPTVMTPEKIAAARALLLDKTIATTARKIGVSRGTLYAHMDAITAETPRRAGDLFGGSA